MTNKKYKPRKFTTSNKKVVISESTGDELKEYICSYCSYNTVVRMDNLSLYCNHCHMISLIEDLQEAQHLEPPKTLDNIETLVSTTPLPGYGDVAIKKPPNYKGSFAELSKKGIKIKDYTVTDGAGRPIREEEDQ